jgi:hypothetical protein
MPAKSATASHLRDKRLLLQRKKRGRERPGVKEISATIQPAAIADGFKNMEKSPRFDRNQTNIIRLAVQIKTRACSERVARLFRSEHAPTL